MTDTERERINAICEIANVKDIGDLSDGFHTFNGLYEQRMILFAALVKAYRDKAWKSYRHEDGELCFGGGWFIVGIDTPEGSYTYHYKNEYWDMFDCVDLPRAKHWDGHTEADAETRLMSLSLSRPEMKLAHPADMCYQKLRARVLLPSWYSVALEAEKAKIRSAYKKVLAEKMAELLEPYIECEVSAGFDGRELLYGTLYVREKGGEQDV